MDSDFGKVTEFLRSSNADIVAVQEYMPDDSGRDIVAFLTKLGYHSAVSSSWEIRKDGRKMGVALFSKYPICRTSTVVLSEDKRRLAVEADIEVGEALLKVFSVHTLHTHLQESDILNGQVEHLIKALPEEKVVVMGDFNATPDMTTIVRMRKVLVDTDPTLAPTWSLNPKGCEGCVFSGLTIKLDYIFASRDLKTHSFKVETDAKGSDHLPVSVVVEI